MREIWRRILRSRRNQVVTVEYLPCRIYALNGQYLWKVTHHGRIVAKGKSETFARAAKDAAAAVYPTKIVIGSDYGTTRDR